MFYNIFIYIYVHLMKIKVYLEKPVERMNEIVKANHDVTISSLHKAQVFVSILYLFEEYKTLSIILIP